MLQYLENILSLIDSLSCDLQDKENIMGYGPVTSSKMAAILDCRVVKYDTIKHFAAFW